MAGIVDGCVTAGRCWQDGDDRRVVIAGDGQCLSRHQHVKSALEPRCRIILITLLEREERGGGDG